MLDDEGKKRLGEVVRQLRRNQTQKEFANMLGIGQSTLSMWETGKVTPDLENLEKLADVWGKKPEEFVAYLYGRKLLSDSLPDAIGKMSVHELAELQILISNQMADRLKMTKQNYINHKNCKEEINNELIKSKI